MTEGLFRKTVGAGAQVAQIGLEAARVKERVEHAVEDGVTAAKHAVEDGVIAAKRAAKRGQYAAEDLLDETTHCVKRNPLSAVAVSFWAGFGLGALAIWVTSHNHRD
jgi:ElaB/YqjD/DUF883 family membrane-anchored ribosome-binding protein